MSLHLDALLGLLEALADDGSSDDPADFLVRIENTVHQCMELMEGLADVEMTPSTRRTVRRIEAYFERVTTPAAILADVELDDD